MEEVKLVKGDWRAPHHNKLFKWVSKDKEPRYLLGCYKCGEVATLNHTVLIEGTVPTINPSIVCPSCDAHYFVMAGKITKA